MSRGDILLDPDECASVDLSVFAEWVNALDDWSEAEARSRHYFVYTSDNWPSNYRDEVKSYAITVPWQYWPDHYDSVRTGLGLGNYLRARSAILTLDLLLERTYDPDYPKIAFPCLVCKTMIIGGKEPLHHAKHCGSY